MEQGDVRACVAGRGSPASHGGATAGYRTQLNLYPDQGVSVAVLCNAGNAMPAAYASVIAGLYLSHLAAAL